MKNLFFALLVFSVSASSGQSGSELFLFDLKVKDGQVTLSGGVNITNHKGYDNQPFFHPSKPVIYFSSFNDSGRSDIKYYDYKKKTTANLTVTNEREYSPTVTPDGKFISCIIQRDNGVQNLGKYPVRGGEPEVLINDQIGKYDIFLGVMWRRFGTPTGVAESGTEEEFRRALELWAQELLRWI